MNEAGREKGESRSKVEEVYGDIWVTINRDQLYSWGGVFHLFP